MTGQLLSGIVCQNAAGKLTHFAAIVDFDSRAVSIVGPATRLCSVVVGFAVAAGYV